MRDAVHHRALATVTFVVLAGCGFEHGALDDFAQAPDSGTAGPGSGTGSSTLPRTCQFPDASNRLCLEFDDGVLAPVVHDGSTAQLDAAATGLSAVMRAGTDPAAGLDSQSRISLAETPALDISGDELTLEAWIRPDSYQAASIIRNDGQYVLMIDTYGFIGCAVAGAQVFSYSEGTVSPGTWTHIACTYDGDRVRVYRGGSSQDCSDADEPIDTNGTLGTTIAPSFKGAIDGVRIYDKDLGSDLCNHAGATNCQRQCGFSIGF